MEVNGEIDFFSGFVIFIVLGDGELFYVYIVYLGVGYFF